MAKMADWTGVWSSSSDENRNIRTEFSEVFTCLGEVPR
jgi:hypothetical protein